MVCSQPCNPVMVRSSCCVVVVVVICGSFDDKGSHLAASCTTFQICVSSYNCLLALPPRPRPPAPKDKPSPTPLPKVPVPAPMPTPTGDPPPGPRGTWI